MRRLPQSLCLQLLLIILLSVSDAKSQSPHVLIGIVGDQYVAADGTNPYPVLTQAVTLLREQKVRAILHVGDLLEAKGVHSEADYKSRFDVAAQILDQGGVPWFVTPGDHDVVPDLDMSDWTREATDHTREGYFLELYGARKPQLHLKDLYYSFDFEGYHFVALYSIENLRADVRWGNIFRAEVSDAQLHWLEDDLSKHASSNGIIVFTHQPLWYNGASWQRVHRVLRDHHVLAVVAGHFHYSQDEGSVDGIRYVVAGAAGAMVGAPGQDRSPEAGGQPVAMVMKLKHHRVEFEQRELRSHQLFPILARHDLDRVQAFSQSLSELDGDISQHTRVCLDGDGELRNPRQDAGNAPKTSPPSKQPATLDFCAIGNPIDVPADVSVEVVSEKATLVSPQFDPKFCETNSEASCRLRPGRRTAISNTSSVSFISCKQYNYFTKTDDQGGADMFHAILRASGPNSLRANDTIPLQITYRFQGESNPLWVNQTFNLQAEACAPQGIPPGPLGDLDQLFIDSYTATRSTSIQTAPFVVVSGSSLILHRNGQKETARVIPDLYHALKDVDHVPFTVYLQLSPLSKSGQPLTDPQAAALRDLSAKIDAVRNSLASGGYAADEMQRQGQILNDSQTIVSTTLAQRSVDSATLRAFAGRMGSLMLLNARDAGCLQIQGTHSQMMKWKSTLTSAEWNHLVVVNRARHQARYRNAATQYFHWLFEDAGPSWSYPGESMRVIYAESLAPNEDASDEFATVLIDADASAAFFTNPWRLTEDILSGGAEECINKLPDSDRVHP